MSGWLAGVLTPRGVEEAHEEVGALLLAVDRVMRTAMDEVWLADNPQQHMPRQLTPEYHQMLGLRAARAFLYRELQKLKRLRQ
jgi:hypothetical protein